METIYIVDFGSQYTQLIAKVIRSLHCWCKVITKEELLTVEWNGVLGVILSGGPRETYVTDLEICNFLQQKGIAVLGICYGAQLMAVYSGCDVLETDSREFGGTTLRLTKEGNEDKVFNVVQSGSIVWMSHRFSIIPNVNIVPLATTSGLGAFKSKLVSNWYAVQFHPEVYQTQSGKDLIYAFLRFCGVSFTWGKECIKDKVLKEVSDIVSYNDHIVLALSGGVDSMVVATVLAKVIRPENLHCVILDHGFNRKNECKEVYELVKSGFNCDVRLVNAEDDFLEELSGVTDAESRRKIIGDLMYQHIFKAVQEVVLEYKDVWYAQGTIYSDVIESGKSGGDVIKSHHNVGGLPENIGFRLLEPVKYLFKNEVRELGEALGLPLGIIYRHPFPGPGLALRCLPLLTKANLDLLREVDDIYITTLKQTGWYHKIWQSGAVLLNDQSVGVSGDSRTFGRIVVLRAVNSQDGMTASVSDIPMGVLTSIATKITNKVKGVTRVLFDITSKPPATIEML